MASEKETAVAKEQPKIIPMTKDEQYHAMVQGLRANRPATVRKEYIRPDSSEGNSFFVAVNGRKMLIPWDTPVEIPWEVAQVIERSRKSDRALAGRRRKEEESMRAPQMV